jgi:hypothetical protein
MIETYNYDFLKNNGFLFTLDRLPQTNFRMVSCEIPTISIPPAIVPFPGMSVPFAGNTEEFQDFTMEFIVDDDMKNYEEIYHWITQQKFAVSSDEFTPKNSKEEKFYSDGSLVIMNNASNPNRVFMFKNMFPMSLGSVRFNTTVSEPQPVQCSVTFKYTYFEMKKISYIQNPD